MSVYQRLAALEITLPEMAAPAAAFLPAVRVGDLLFVSGHVAKRDGKPWTGQLGAALTTEEGRQAARQAAVDVLGTLHAVTGNLDSVRRVVKLMVLVNSAPTFTEQHLVANGASELLGRDRRRRRRWQVVQRGRQEPEAEDARAAQHDRLVG
jgi:enamine deaminase RidA (YjgF/YER057c/UK114 family)